MLVEDMLEVMMMPASSNSIAQLMTNGLLYLGLLPLCSGLAWEN